MLVLAVGLLLNSERAGRWLLQQLPGLTVEGFSGRLGSAWQADLLRWEQDGVRVSLTAAALAWSPSCLVHGTFCVDELRARQVDVRVASSDTPAESGPVELPDLQLPIGIRLGDVEVGGFSFDGDRQLADIKLLATWQEDGIVIERLSVVRDGLALDLHGRVQPQAGWPLQASAQLKLPAPAAQDWQVSLDASGELAGRLVVKGSSSGYLVAQMSGEVAALAENVPAKIQIVADTFRPDVELPAPLTLKGLSLDASGDLSSGYAVNGRAMLPGAGGDVAVALIGRVDARGAQIGRLDLLAAEQQRLNVSGNIDWQDELQISSQLDWLDFPWQRLFPQDPPSPLAVRSLKATMNYQAGHYEGRFDGQFNGPAGEFSAGSPVQGDLQQVSLPELQVKAGKGSVSGPLQVTFDNGIGWNTRLQVDALDPSYWLAQLPGSLAGHLESRGRYAQVLELMADIRLEGRLRGQTATLKAQLDGAGKEWRLSALQADLGDNHVQGQGSLGQRLDGRLQLDLRRMGQLWPGLAGTTAGTLQLAGSLQAPEGQLQLKGNGLAYQDLRIHELTLSALLDTRQQATLSLHASDLASGASRYGDLDLQGSGNRENQRLALAFEGEMAKSVLAFDGRWDGRDWKGRLASGEITGGGQTWSLQQVARLERFADGRLELGRHCWMSGDASLCGGEQRLLPEARLDYKLRQFPLASLQPWLPEDFAWQGTLNADLDLRLPSSGPDGTIRLDAGGGTLRMRQEQQWIDFPYQRLQLESILKPQRIDSQLLFEGGNLGALQVNARIDPRPAQKTLSGSFRITGVDLSVARPFVPGVETLAGHLQGSGSLAGTLQAPNVQGDLRLSDGAIAGSELPTQVENLQIDARITGESAEVSGSWRSGKLGQGGLSGNLAWGEQPRVDLALRGNRLPVVVEPYANLEVDPDLRVALASGRLALSGAVAIPRGSITVRELPPQAVKVSPDARIVGEEEPQRQELQLAMDVMVNVGEERLRFTGFGLTADLNGRLQVGDNLATRGELVLKNGRYRAYGQRLDLQKARLLFAGPIDQPYLDIEAVRKVGDVTAGVRLTGRADEPRSEVFSSPSMSQQQALSYLVLGRPMDASNDNNALGQAALALGLSGSAPLTSELAERLGIQDFQLGDDGASGRLSDRLTIRYGLGIVEPSSVVALRYELTKRLYIEAASGLASSLDLFYKRDF
ncbi:translocation/assembly module TamB domain-containing protein [Pseudomonas sp. LRF_L74]|uniref:translocation/assembly module TamB domain-containing protein n=1 Tax=Pseudomonas sp. LRF_L74 TaxID=3369422 RepID=UPI003F632E0F